MQYHFRTCGQGWSWRSLSLAALLLCSTARPATISINDGQLAEGNTGTSNAIFTVTLSEAGTQEIRVNYATASDTATAGSDFQSATGTLIFPAGTLSATIAVPVIGDTVIEPNETFVVNLSTPVNATLARSQGIGTIVDDETRTLWFTNSTPITIPSSGAGSPYPSVIDLSGLPGKISQVKVALDRLEHSYPDDLDIILVNSRTNVLLLSDRGGSTAITNVNLVFDDAAAATAPDSSKISSGTYKPSNDGSLDYLPSPVPYPPHGNQLRLFSGDSPNGKWSFYVVDDTGGDAGILRGGWRLGITTTNLVSPGAPTEADLSVTVTDSPDTALTEQPLTYLLTVINSGPAAATGVVLSNLLPTEVEFLSAASSQGSCSQAGGVVTCNLGNLGVGAVATVTVRVTPHATGIVNTSATVSGLQTDPLSANDVATASTLVALGPPSMLVSDIVVTERNTPATNAIFTVGLSRASDKTITVDYATANGTASSTTDYYATSGSLTFAPGVTNLEVSVPVPGDRNVEPDEVFFLNLANPVNAILTRSQASATIFNDDGLAGQVDRFQWSAMGSNQHLYVPFPVTIRAMDAFGNLASNFNGTVSLTGLTGTGTNAPRLLITEVDLAASDGVELANLTAFPLDLAGWRVYFYDWSTWPAPSQTFDFPSGSVAAPGGIITLTDTGTAPGSYPSFVTEQNISWFNEATNNQVAVLVVDPAGQAADFFCAVEVDPAEILLPLPIPASQWSGSSAAPNTTASLTYQRIGSVDHNNVSDWQLTGASMGSTNAGLTVPFAGPRPVTVSPAVSGNFNAGVWAGTVAAAQIVTNMYVLAQDDNGHAGASGSFAVLPSTDLSVTQSAQPASLSVGQDITFTLRLTNSGPASAQSVTLSNTLPANVNFKSANTTQGSVSRSGSIVTATIGSMASASQVVVTIVATASAPGGATNNANASTTSVDYRATNNFVAAGAWVNYPPSITAIPSQSMLEDGAPPTVAFSVQDVESPAGSLTVAAVSSNPALVPSTNLVLSGSGAARSVTITPLLNQYGVATITVSAADSQNTTSTNFLLTVTSVNDAPVLSPIATQAVDENSLLSLYAAASDVESPPQTLTFSLVSGPGGVNVQPATGQITWTPGEALGGSTQLVTVRVSDNGSPSLSATQSFSVIVRDVNSPPVLTAIPTQTVNVPASLAWQAAATDPDIPIDTLTFSLISGPAGLTVSPTGVIAWTPTDAAWPATNLVTLRVQDAGSPSLGNTGSFQVIVNHRPVPTSPTLNRFSAVAAKLPVADLLGSDPDGDGIVLQSIASLSTQNITVRQDGTWAYYTPSNVFAQSDSFSYVTRDSRGATNVGTVTLNVLTDTNTNPSLTVNNLGNGSFFVRFSGIPGGNYRIDATASLQNPDWQPIGSTTADESGVAACLDVPPGGILRYYRIAPLIP